MKGKRLSYLGNTMLGKIVKKTTNTALTTTKTDQNRSIKSASKVSSTFSCKIANLKTLIINKLNNFILHFLLTQITAFTKKVSLKIKSLAFSGKDLELSSIPNNVRLMGISSVSSNILPSFFRKDANLN